MQSQVNALHSSSCKEVLLYTALITLQGSRGTQRTFRALIDPGSQSSFLTEYAAQSLALPKRRVIASVTGLGQSEVATPRSMVKTSLVIPSCTYVVDITALVLPNLTNYLPSKPITSSNWHHIQGLKLADPTFDRPGRIDVILGADVYGSILLPDICKGLRGHPIAQNTVLGWIICGEVAEVDCKTAAYNTFTSISLTTLNQQIQKFWLIEEVPAKLELSRDDQICETFYKTTHTRSKDGRYCVRLPFIDEIHKQSLGCSRATAIGSFRSLEKRFMSNPTLRIEYTKCIKEYLELGHMVPATSSEDDKVQRNNNLFCTSYYLPHHAVLKDSASTHLRVVFEASRKTSSGYSLNDVLLTGPTLQNELIAVLSRWRKFKVVLLADIVKMYRQVLVHSDDINYQRIVWRDSPADPLKDYCLTTVTFGITSAPYLAIRTIQQLAEDERNTYPDASKIALNDFYVDDLLTGADSLPEAMTIYQHVDTLLKLGGFKLKKWLSNNPDLLTEVPEEDKALPNCVDLSLDQGVKSLGIIWHPSSDTFSYKITISSEQMVASKRQLLSEIVKLYDPLGWIAPVVVHAKILMQSLWILGCEWDEPVSPRIQQTWSALKSQLHLLERLRIPRWTGITKKNTDIQLHAFSDASQHAYAAAVYLRVQSPDIDIQVHLIMSKTKVAPIKQVSIPRLELCGAVLSAKLVRYVRETLQLDHNISVHMWTDSSIVLAWLKGQPRKWATFVANRTSEIFNQLGNVPSHHVSSEDNPADLASRGLLPAELLTSILWWNGPKWLTEHCEQWPRSGKHLDTELEARKSLYAFHIQPVNKSFLLEFLTKFSSFPKLIRITAYCLRIFKRSKPEQTWLTSQELMQATTFWLKFHQHAHFSKEINYLQRHNTPPTDSKLKNLNPFLDKDELLRVGGRLQNANLSYNEQHPIILGKSSHLTTLIIRQYHLSCLHGGTQLTLSLLRKKYWVLDGRNTIRKLLLQCITCFRLRAKTNTQLMGSLPQPRVNVSRPFTNTGVDYCGPINIKTSKRRGAPASKGYIAVFVCLAVKAIHLELVSELSTPAFLAALQRFIGRRGTPQHLYSDCGTNFIGANAYLKEVSRQQKQFAERVSRDGITWHFNPPHSPHFGGLWEAGVKSTKYHLRRIVGNVILTFEELATTLCQVEACLNSRPLCPVTDDSTDLNALTPGHFLIGDALLAPPQPDLLAANCTYLNRWQLTQQLAQQFWKRWATEYITRLQQRPKWLRIQPNVKKGDLVLVKDDRLPPLNWPIGLVIEVYPGIDGLVRAADVKMKNSIVRRSIVKLATFPTTDAYLTNNHA